MAYERDCNSCGISVRCREERRDIAPPDKYAVTLFCPNCGRKIGTVFEGLH